MDKEFLARIERLQTAMTAKGVDVVFLYTPVNRLYFTGLPTSNGLLLVERQGAPIFYTDFRYISNSKRPIKKLDDIKGLKQILEDVKADIPVATYTMDDSGQEKITSSEVYMIVSLVLAIIIYMFIAMFSAMVMQSVIEEKSSRVVEVLISSVNSLELMFGKIIGVAAVALTQFFLWIFLTLFYAMKPSLQSMESRCSFRSSEGEEISVSRSVS